MKPPSAISQDRRGPEERSGGQGDAAGRSGEDSRAPWSLRDGINIAETAVLAALNDAVAHREALLAGVRRASRRVVERGRQGLPYAWVFHPVQRDPARLARLVGRLRDEGVEVGRLSSELSLEGGSWPAGSLIVRLDQPARDSALLLLGPPSPGGTDRTGTTVAGWNLPLLAGVAGEWVDDPKVLQAALDQMDQIADKPGAATPADLGAAPAPAGGVSGEGDFFLLRDQGQGGLPAAAVLLASYQVDVAEEPFVAAGRRMPAGSWIIQAPRATLEALAVRFGWSFTAVAEAPGVRRHVVHLPRLALLHGWSAAAGTGWARRALDRSGVPYHLLTEDELRQGHLGERFDVILLPDAGVGCDGLLRGLDPRWSPLAYTKTPESPSLGTPDAAADVTGGMGEEGLAELDRFVTGGGVLAAFGSAALLPVEGGLAGGIEVLPTAGLHTSDSLLWATAPQPLHPLVYGIGAAGGAGPVTGDSAESGSFSLQGLPVWRRDGPLFDFHVSTGADGTESGDIGGEGGGESGGKGVRDAGGGSGGSDLTNRSDRAGRSDLAEASAAVPPSPAPLPSSGAPEASAAGPVRVLLRFGAGDLSSLAAAPGPTEQPGAPGAGGTAGATGTASPPEIEVEEMEPGAAAEAATAKSDQKPGSGPPVDGPGGTTPATASPAPAPNPAWWAAGDPLVAAGTVEHPEEIDGKPAILDLPRGRGHLLLFAFDPFYLDPDRADLRLIDNLLLNWSNL